MLLTPLTFVTYGRSMHIQKIIKSLEPVQKTDQVSKGLTQYQVMILNFKMFPSNYLKMQYVITFTQVKPLQLRITIVLVLILHVILFFWNIKLLIILRQMIKLDFFFNLGD